jgi:hypothetical protein
MCLSSQMHIYSPDTLRVLGSGVGPPRKCDDLLTENADILEHNRFDLKLLRTARPAPLQGGGRRTPTE